MNLIGKGKVHETGMKVFGAVPGDDIEFLVGCKVCGMVSEATFTVPDPAMGSLKLIYRCPRCRMSGMLVLSPVQGSR